MYHSGEEELGRHSRTGLGTPVLKALKCFHSMSKKSPCPRSPELLPFLSPLLPSPWALGPHHDAAVKVHYLAGPCFGYTCCPFWWFGWLVLLRCFVSPPLASTRRTLWESTSSDWQDRVLGGLSHVPCLNDGRHKTWDLGELSSLGFKNKTVDFLFHLVSLNTIKVLGGRSSAFGPCPP